LSDGGGVTVKGLREFLLNRGPAFLGEFSRGGLTGGQKS
jgi:hypothetical protein